MTRAIAAFMMSLSACTPPAAERPSVSTGERTWMAVNLADTLYRNGDPILHVSTAEALWAAGESGTGAWMHTEAGPAAAESLGVLYNWHAFMDPRGLGPGGWRPPTTADWESLEHALGADSAGWQLQNGPFKAMLAGFRHYTGVYEGLGHYGSWWTSDVRPDDPWYVFFRGVGTDYTELYLGESSTYYGMSVRLVRDTP